MKLISDVEIVKPVKDSMLADILDGNRHLGRAICQAQLASCEQQAEEEIKKRDKRIAKLKDTCTQWEWTVNDLRFALKRCQDEHQAELRQVKAEIEKLDHTHLQGGLWITKKSLAEYWKGKGIE